MYLYLYNSQLVLELFCFLLFINFVFGRDIIFRAITIIFLFPLFMIIMVIFIAIIYMVFFLVLIFTIMLSQQKIHKVLFIGSIIIIVYNNKRLKIGKNFFTYCYKSKHCKFMHRQSMRFCPSDDDELVFAYITQFWYLFI